MHYSYFRTFRSGLAIAALAILLIPRKARTQYIPAGTSQISPLISALTTSNTVIFVDRMNFKYPETVEPGGGHSFTTEYTIANESWRFLHTKTNAFCSGGQTTATGQILMTGGENGGGIIKTGSTAIRLLTPCSNGTCDWVDDNSPQMQLMHQRWYNTVQKLPDGRVIVMGGAATGTARNTPEKNAPTYEFFPKKAGEKLNDMEFLRKTTMPDNLFPFIHLLPTGKLYVMANIQSMMFDPAIGVSTQENLATMPDGANAHRSYPLTATSVMLPLVPDAADKYPITAEVLICGGGDPKALPKNINVPAVKSCGRLIVGQPNATWHMEDMPWGLIMPNSILLPDGTILIINGAKAGFSGFSGSTQPALQPLLYRPNAPVGSRFTPLARTTIARVYHSEALLIPDGRVIISGSQPLDKGVNLEKRVEMFLPPYMQSAAKSRPVITSCSKTKISYGEYFSCDLAGGMNDSSVDGWTASFIETGFSTHSMNQGQRMVYVNVRKCGSSTKPSFYFKAPPSPNLLPPGPYMFFLTHEGIPSEARWISIDDPTQNATASFKVPTECLVEPTSTHSSRLAVATRTTDSSDQSTASALSTTPASSFDSAIGFIPTTSPPAATSIVPTTSPLAATSAASVLRLNSFLSIFCLFKSAIIFARQPSLA